MPTPYYDIIVDVLESHMETDPLWMPTSFAIRVPGPMFKGLLNELVVAGTRNKFPPETTSILLTVCGLSVTVSSDDVDLGEKIQ